MTDTQPYTIPKMKRTKYRSDAPKALSPASDALVGPARLTSAYTTGRMIDEGKLPTHYTFFKENKTEKAFNLSIEELKKRYLAYLKTKDVDWILWLGMSTVAAFVKENLSSTIEMTAYLKLEMALTATLHNFYPDQKKKTKLKRTR